MKNDLLEEVTAKIQANKGKWRQIAADLPGVSYSWISQVGRGEYKSAPSYARLRKVADYLKKAA